MEKKSLKLEMRKHVKEISLVMANIIVKVVDQSLIKLVKKGEKTNVVKISDCTIIS